MPLAEPSRTGSSWTSTPRHRPLLAGNRVLTDEPSALEQVYAVFANVIAMDDDGLVLNAKHAERRAAQWLRSYIDPSYQVSPALEDCEIKLYDAPPRQDPGAPSA
jgi:hypothetical protein